MPSSLELDNDKAYLLVGEAGFFFSTLQLLHHSARERAVGVAGAAATPLTAASTQAHSAAHASEVDIRIARPLTS